MNVNLAKVLVVGIGGFIGAALRYIISGLSAKAFGDSFPYGTLIVNVAGGFIMGFIMEAGTSVWPLPETARIFMTTGILGGLTTFSTFSYETVNMFEDHNYLMGSLNAGANLFLALTAAWLGRQLALIFA